jgi:hypothetical protein
VNSTTSAQKTNTALKIVNEDMVPSPLIRASTTVRISRIVHRQEGKGTPPLIPFENFGQNLARLETHAKGDRSIFFTGYPIIITVQLVDILISLCLADREAHLHLGVAAVVHVHMAGASLGPFR